MQGGDSRVLFDLVSRAWAAWTQKIQESTVLDGEAFLAVESCLLVASHVLAVFKATFVDLCLHLRLHQVSHDSVRK